MLFNKFLNALNSSNPCIMSFLFFSYFPLPARNVDVNYIKIPQNLSPWALCKQYQIQYKDKICEQKIIIINIYEFLTLRRMLPPTPPHPTPPFYEFLSSMLSKRKFEWLLKRFDSTRPQYTILFSSCVACWPISCLKEGWITRCGSMEDQPWDKNRIHDVTNCQL